MASDSSKAFFRSWWKERCRQGIPDTGPRSQEICKQISQEPAFKKAKHVGIYCARGMEVSLKPLWELRPDACVLPKVIQGANGAPMAFFQIDSWKDLQPGFKGILEPKDPSSPAIQWTKTDLVLVPGLVFDARGGRIGSGLGYYDRFFAVTDVPRWGVCWKEQIVDEVLAQDPTDARMKALCSDDGMHWVENA